MLGCMQPIATSPVVISPPVKLSPPAPAVPPASVGIASWYGPGFEGRRTASGERFHSGELTAASPNLSLGSLVRVTNPSNGRSVLVRINDCGPHRHNRKIDLSRRAANQLAITKRGVTKVKIEVLDEPTDTPRCRGA